MSKLHIIKTPHGKMVRKECYPVQRILREVQFKNKHDGKWTKSNFDGDKMNMASDRYKLFAKKGCKCCVCGIEGFYFAKERFFYNKSPLFHFNLYGLSESGEEVLLTKDHIIPKSRGGEDHQDNYQVMCQPCNEAKSNKMPADLYTPAEFHDWVAEEEFREQLEAGAIEVVYE